MLLSRGQDKDKKLSYLLYRVFLLSESAEKCTTFPFSALKIDVFPHTWNHLPFSMSMVCRMTFSKPKLVFVKAITFSK